MFRLGSIVFEGFSTNTPRTFMAAVVVCKGSRFVPAFLHLIVTGESMSNSRLTKQDPRTQYPRPPFEPQHQGQPGLAKDMNPEPDHGESSYVGSGKLKGRKALVTGGDSGIGRAVAIAFAREGADVAIGYLEGEASDAKQVLALIEKAGVKAVGIPGDIAKEEFCRTLVKRADEALGGLDILVNNAGTMTSHTNLLEVTSAEFDKVMKTNVYALFWITQAAIPLLKPGASVINTTSIQAYEPSRGIIDYAMTKAAIVAFTKGMVPQLMEQGVRINAVAPGPFWTPIQPSGQPPEKLAELGKEVPFGRPGQPVEIAPVFVLLASQEGSYITGEIYGVTGGTGVA
jgi:NAD(P)-dependent dehydrogenase (short-subunit alcohol dehydrogenase family)